MAARNYSEDLRAIGQILEARNINVFEIKQLADLYVIRGTPEPPKSLGSKLIVWTRRVRDSSETDPLILQWPDLEKLAEEGRAQRSTAAGVTEFRQLSNLLRTIGAYLDSSEVELVALEKRPISITLSYRDGGEEIQEDRSISSFYEDFVELCRQRAQR